MLERYLLIGADIVPTESNNGLFKSGEIKELVGKDLLSLNENAEYRIFNLEVPLVNEESPIDKWGPALKAETNTINGYKNLGIDLLTLANNHIMDQGCKGLYSTCNVLKENNIQYIGVGDNLEEACKSMIVSLFNRKIGIYACVENEFSVATKCSPGANPFDPFCSLDHVEVLKKECDFVIVLYHGGKEHYRYPSPYLQKVCRKLVDKGANLVICQHSHCIGCEENWGEGKIVYGQGNFLFDDCDLEEWQTSLLIKVSQSFEIEYIPLVKVANRVAMAEGMESQKILDAFYERSRKIQQEGFIEEEYYRFAQQYEDMYLKACAGRQPLIFRIFDKLLKRRISNSIPNKRYKKMEKLALINYIECEAHRELFLAGMKEWLRGENRK